MGDDDSWRTSAYRQSVASKIEEAIRQSGMNISRNSSEMENHVFQKAKTKEEYLGYVASLIQHVREMSTKKEAGMGGPGNNQGPGVPDLTNAVQTLAIHPVMNMQPQQGPMRGQQLPTATNLQNLNHPIQNKMLLALLCMAPLPNMGMGPNSGPMPNQMGPMSHPLPNQISNQMSNQLPGQMQMGSMVQ